MEQKTRKQGNLIRKPQGQKHADKEIYCQQLYSTIALKGQKRKKIYGVKKSCKTLK